MRNFNYSEIKNQKWDSDIFYLKPSFYVTICVLS